MHSSVGLIYPIITQHTFTVSLPPSASDTLQSHSQLLPRPFLPVYPLKTRPNHKLYLQRFLSRFPLHISSAVINTTLTSFTWSWREFCCQSICTSSLSGAVCGTPLTFFSLIFYWHLFYAGLIFVLTKSFK